MRGNVTLAAIGMLAAASASPAAGPEPQAGATFDYVNIFNSTTRPSLLLADTGGPNYGFMWSLTGHSIDLDETSTSGSFIGSVLTASNWRNGSYLLIKRDTYIERPLTVNAADGTAHVLIEEYSPNVVGRNLLRLKNNGPSTFRFENKTTGTAWGFGSLNAGDKFFITSTAAPGLDLTLDPAGNLTLLGTLVQLSDRNAKRDVETLDGSALLQKVAALPLSSWAYKADAQGARHIGPMAQDFAAAFGLGSDDTHVAPSDVAGVSLAAAQALKRENDELRAELAILAERLSAIEAREAGAP